MLDEMLDAFAAVLRQLQGNTFQIPIVPTQRTNANIEKKKNSLKDS